jgi:hypothetical protein
MYACLYIHIYTHIYICIARMCVCVCACIGTYTYLCAIGFRRNILAVSESTLVSILPDLAMFASWIYIYIYIIYIYIYIYMYVWYMHVCKRFVTTCVRFKNSTWNHERENKRLIIGLLFLMWPMMSSVWDCLPSFSPWTPSLRCVIENYETLLTICRPMQFCAEADPKTRQPKTAWQTLKAVLIWLLPLVTVFLVFRQRLFWLFSRRKRERPMLFWRARLNIVIEARPWWFALDIQINSDLQTCTRSNRSQRFFTFLILILNPERPGNIFLSERKPDSNENSLTISKVGMPIKIPQRQMTRVDT